MNEQHTLHILEIVFVCRHLRFASCHRFNFSNILVDSDSVNRM